MVDALVCEVQATTVTLTYEPLMVYVSRSWKNMQRF